MLQLFGVFSAVAWWELIRGVSIFGALRGREVGAAAALVIPLVALNAVVAFGSGLREFELKMNALGRRERQRAVVGYWVWLLAWVALGVSGVLRYVVFGAHA